MTVEKFAARAALVNGFLFSDARRLADWRSAVSDAPPTCGVILRDYDAPDRVALAVAMAALCRRQNRPFAIAGDWRLARRFGARFHCPSYLLRRPNRLGPIGACDTAAVHNEKEVRLAARAGFRRVFISPVFATNSHRGARVLGPVQARHLGLMAQNLGLGVYALGGMNASRLRRLNGTQGAAGPFIGFGAIAAFAKS